MQLVGLGGVLWLLTDKKIMDMIKGEMLSVVVIVRGKIRIINLMKEKYYMNKIRTARL